MRNRGYLYVKALSDLGSRMDMIAFGALIFASTGSAAWLSALLGVHVLGGLLSGFASGAAADRYDRRRLMIASDWARGILILLLIPFPKPEMILLVRFLTGFSASFFEVSYNAEIPQIYGSRSLISVNAAISRLGAVSMVVGFLGGGLLQDRLGYESVLALDAASYFISAVFLLRMKWDRDSPDRSARIGLSRWSAAAALRAQFDDLKVVGAHLRLRIGLLIVFVVFLMDAFGSASHNLGIPLLADSLAHDRQALYYGLIWSVWGAGNVLATLALPKLRLGPGGLRRLYLAAAPLMSLGFIAIFAAQGVAWILVAALVTGVCDGLAVTALMTLLQQTDNRIRGRLFGVFTVLSKLGFGLGFIAAPLALAHMPLLTMVLVFHGTVILAAAAGLALYSRTRDRHADTAAEPDPVTRA
ncbi:MFS transporter [Cohnella sp. 56]|uniref:MFS transporter n=1 Tax=Cohnella sp. 56 TaxID=3113722 RepID=UPI0030E7A977